MPCRMGVEQCTLLLSSCVIPAGYLSSQLLKASSDEQSSAPSGKPFQCFVIFSTYSFLAISSQSSLQQLKPVTTSSAHCKQDQFTLPLCSCILHIGKVLFSSNSLQSALLNYDFFSLSYRITACSQSSLPDFLRLLCIFLEVQGPKLDTVFHLMAGTEPATQPESQLMLPGLRFALCNVTPN